MKQSIAKGRILLAIERLLSDQPLYAGVLAQWKLVEDEVTMTMAVGFRNGRLTLYFNPQFVASISIEELAGVLCHEALHCIMGHCEHEPAPDENKRARTIAEEVTVNEWVRGVLPYNPILLSDYPSLSPNEDTQTRYDQLLQILPDEQKTLDDHSRWTEVLKNGQLSSAVIASVLAGVWEQMTPAQKQNANLPATVQKIVEQAVQSSGMSMLGQGTASVPWQKVLRRYVGRALTRRPVFTRPPRRFPELVGILPGRSRQSSKPKILAAIDTSGSMCPDTLSHISAELALMNKTHEGIVVECDDKIHAVYPYRPITNVHGRGGTDFRPVFAKEFLGQHKPDLVIYFTDGYGKAPVCAPAMPVIWCLTGRGKQPCNWGRTLHIT